MLPGVRSTPDRHRCPARSQRPWRKSKGVAAEASRSVYQTKLSEAGFGAITTEILEAPEFYFAEDYHQQYLAKVPHGYCGLGGTGVACPAPTGVAARPKPLPANADTSRSKTRETPTTTASAV